MEALRWKTTGAGNTLVDRAAWRCYLFAIWPGTMEEGLKFTVSVLEEGGEVWTLIKGDGLPTIRQAHAHIERVRRYLKPPELVLREQVKPNDNGDIENKTK